ncbi:MAG: zinc ribbon domain-containing protein [Chloroflexi bacterium]|nr:zinc ribbon domain-containing protein [Chloroflexota bacterium]
MPIYEYVCSDCGMKFELLRSLSQSNDEANCPHCQSPSHRVLSRFACFSNTDGGSATPLGGGGWSGCTASDCGTCAS